MRKPRIGVISIKVTFWVSVVVIAIVAVHIYWTKPERRFFEQKMRESERIAQIIEAHLLAEMMAGEPDNIQRHMGMLPRIEGIRSVEIMNMDKVVRFSHKDEHQLVLEPEGPESRSIYLNGLSNSMPEEVQLEMVRTSRTRSAAFRLSVVRRSTPLIASDNLPAALIFGASL